VFVLTLVTSCYTSSCLPLTYVGGIINKVSQETSPSSVQLSSPRSCPLPYTNASACENKIKANFSIKLVQIGRQNCTYPPATIPPIRKSTENFFFPFFPCLFGSRTAPPHRLGLLDYPMLLVRTSSNSTSFSLVVPLIGKKTTVTM